MSKVYDNWERLVAATLKRQQYRELALADSRETSFSSSVSARFATRFNFKFGSPISYKKKYYAERIWAAEQVMKATDAATSFKPDCLELKSKVQKLESLLRQAARASSSLYDRPARRIMDDVEQVLQKALNLILKCRGVRRVFATIPSTAFPEVSSQLEHTIRNVSWLLRDDEYSSGVPPIAAEEPTLCHIWELIAILQTGSAEDQCEAVASLVSLAREDVAYQKLIFDEGGFPALLRLLKEGKPEAQVNAAIAIGLLQGEGISLDVEIVDLFVTTLWRGTMEVQAAVAWAVSELVENNSQWHYLFEKNDDIIPLLMKHILLDSTPFQSNVQADKENTNNSKEHLTAMAAQALHHLAEGNPRICQRIVTSGVLSRLTVLLQKGLPEDVRYHSLMALVAITAVADRFFEFKNSTMRPNSAGRNVIVYELLRLIEMGDALIIPCVRAIGNLAWSFKAKETVKISPLVRLLNDDQEASEVTKEVCVALSNFASRENYLRLEFSNVIVDAGGIERLVQLVYSGERTIQSPALVLLIHIVPNVPDREEVVRAECLTVLEWAKKQPSLIDDVDVDKSLLDDAIERLEFHKKR